MSRYDSLPKWAQDEITHLEREVDRLKDEILTIQGERPKSNTLVNPFKLPSSPKPFFLEKNAMVEFQGKNERQIVRANVDLFSNRIRVDIGDGVIVPQARNVVHIYWEKPLPTERRGAMSMGHREKAKAPDEHPVTCRRCRKNAPKTFRAHLAKTRMSRRMRRAMRLEKDS